MKNTILHFLQSHILIAPFLLLFLEELALPLPIPADVTIMFLGYEVSVGVISYWQAFTILLSAVVIGSSTLFFLTKRYGKSIVKKFGDGTDLDQKKLETMSETFKRYGILVIIFGRHIPGFRGPITIFAATAKVSYRSFFLSVVISAIPWITFYLWLGGRLGPNVMDLVHHHHEYIFLILVRFFILCF